MEQNRKSAGFLTLMVAVMLLLVGSYAFFESADSSLFLMKRFQNTLAAKKLHWAAQGGLECAFAVNKQNTGVLPTLQSYTDCDKEVLPVGERETLDLRVTAESVNGSLYNFKSKASESHGRGERIVSKNIEATSSSVMPGIFKTSSKFTLDGSFNLLPNKNTTSNGENECITMVVKNKANFVHTDSVKGSTLVVQDSNGYDDVAGVDGTGLTDKVGNFICKEGYQSFHEVGKEANTYANDIVEDIDMDMFKDMFGTTREKWKSIRDSQFIGHDSEIINKDNASSMVMDCAAKISNAYNEGKRKIWVDGSCYINKLSLSDIHNSAPFNFNEPNVNPSNQKVLVVVRDGVVFSADSFSFGGLLYQFDSGERAKKSILEDMVQACIEGQLCNASDTSQQDLYKNLAFFVNGSMHTYGGLAIDMEGMELKVKGALISAYDNSKWQGLVSSSASNIKWKEGTWRDQ